MRLALIGNWRFLLVGKVEVGGQTLNAYNPARNLQAAVCCRLFLAIVMPSTGLVTSSTIHLSLRSSFWGQALLTSYCLTGASRGPVTIAHCYRMIRTVHLPRDSKAFLNSLSFLILWLGS